MSLLAQALQDSPAYMPHGMCYLWRPQLLWLHVVSDVLTGAAYFAIPPSLFVLVLRARREVPEGAEYVTRRLPLEWMFIAFGLFIVACGSTHFLAAWNVWHADYWLAGGAKALTTVASLGTAIALPPLIPRALRLVRDARTTEVHRRGLESANVELRRLNGRLREMDELRTQLFANVSHELRTPLALIVGPLAHRLKEDDLSDDLRGELELACRNGWLLQKRVDDLLDIARSEVGEARLREEPLDAAEIVRRTARRFEGAARARELMIDVELPRSLPAMLDGDKFERIIGNLLSNAIKFTPAEGTVRVKLAVVGGEIRFDVEDTGPGVPEEHRESVFERFRQLDGSMHRAAGGTGLGLAIVREFARLHGGEAALGRSAMGGAHFNVRLPYREPQPGAERSWVSSEAVAAELTALDPPPAAVDTRAVAAGTAPRVLIVEDDEGMRRFARRVLESEFECAVADGGEAALTMLDRWTPEVVVTDIMMPGMDGFELLEAMRRQPELDDIPVLVLSALAETTVRARMLRQGAHDFVTKPFEPEELRARVSNLIDMKRARDVLRRELNSAGADVHQMAEELARRKRSLADALDEVSAARDRADAANESKTNFLAVMSHELRTPLNAVLGYADLLDLGLEGTLNEGQKGQLSRIQVAARHLLRTIEDVLLFARTEPGARPMLPQPVLLPEFLDEIVGLVRPDADRKGLTVTIEADEATVMADRVRLRHVVTNLVANAVKFTPEEGEVAVRAWVEDGRLLLSVADTGPGIRPEHMERIFEPFWQADQSTTRSTGGAGLGLSIARRTARQLGGDVHVESDQGRGSRFSFWMPVEEADRAA